MTSDAQQPQGKLLADIVRRVLDSGQTSRSVATRAQRKGYKLSHSYVANAANCEVAKAPDETMIEALATGLEVPAAEIRRAVLAGWYRWGDPTDVAGTMVIPVPGDMTAGEADAIRAMAQAFLDTRRNG